MLDQSYIDSMYLALERNEDDCFTNDDIANLLAEIARLQPLAELGQAVMDMPEQAKLLHHLGERWIYQPTSDAWEYYQESTPLAALLAAKGD